MCWHICSTFVLLIFLISTFQENHLTFGQKVETAYKSTLFLPFVKGSGRWRREKDAFDGKRERDVPSLERVIKS